MGSNKLAAHSRVWVYAAERALTEAEANTALAEARNFVAGWAAHGHQLFADAQLLHRRFLLIIVDEQQAGASGCSIDASVHFIQSLGATLGVDFFNRMVFHYRNAEGEVISLPRAEFKQAYNEGKLTEATMVFDPLVKTLGEMASSFEKPLAESWHKRMV